MKIASIRSFLIYPHAPQNGWLGGKNWLFVKVETYEGVSGWGEAYTLPDRDRNIAQLIEDLSRYLIGRDPFHIKQFNYMVYNDFARKRGSMDLFSSTSAIEQALWDIVGKALNTPVYNLLGGPCRERIRVYANGWFIGAETPEKLAQRAIETVASGFTALKFDPFPGPWKLYISREDERTAVENVRAVREAVGEDIDLLIDVHRRLAPMHAIRVARMIERFSPFWYEEPVPSENMDALVEVKRAIRLPVVTGETLYTKMAFRDVFEKQAADIVNPDVTNCGGILELKEIAAIAESYYVAVSPHNYNSTTVALAATIQAAVTMPNFLITEYFVNFAEAGSLICKNPFKVESGYIQIPSAPGLGIDINEEALQVYQYQRSPMREF